jgi:hypothetical protein
MTETIPNANSNMPEGAQPAQINLVDLQNALRIIDVAAERGCFKGPELTAVGATRDRFASFLATAENDNNAGKPRVA